MSETVNIAITKSETLSWAPNLKSVEVRRHGFHGLNPESFRQSSNCASILLLHNFVPPSALIESDKTLTLSMCFSPTLSFHSDPIEVFGFNSGNIAGLAPLLIWARFRRFDLTEHQIG